MCWISGRLKGLPENNITTKSTFAKPTDTLETSRRSVSFAAVREKTGCGDING